MKQFDLSVYLLTHPVDDLLERVRQSIAGGATLIQYRDKIHGDREFLDTGRRVRARSCRDRTVYVLLPNRDRPWRASHPGAA